MTELNSRYNIVEKLTKLFRFERMLHITVTCASLIILLTVVILMIIAKTATNAELALMFGSSGLITYAAGRLLRMWDQALKIIVTGKLDNSDGN